MRTSESVTVLLVVAVLACFMVDLMLSAPPVGAVLGGLVPKLQRDSVYVAVCLLGANVMPHNFLLHRYAFVAMGVLLALLIVGLDACVHMSSSVCLKCPLGTAQQSR